MGRSAKKHPGAVIASLLLLFSLFIYLIGCSNFPGIEVKMEAIRFTPEAINRGTAEAVSLSLWIYDEDGKLIKNIFTSGKLVPAIQKSEWKALGDLGRITVPRKWLSKGGPFTFQVKLNPNRLLTPPDAVFSESVDLGPLIRGEALQRDLVIQSGNKLFELRIGFLTATP